MLAEGRTGQPLDALLQTPGLTRGCGSNHELDLSRRIGGEGGEKRGQRVGELPRERILELTVAADWVKIRTDVQCRRPTVRWGNWRGSVFRQRHEVILDFE